MSNELIDKLIDQEKLHCFEGRRGIINLCKIARAIGYKDDTYFGQLAQGACIGDLTNMLEDNPGIIEAMVNWISEQRSFDDELRKSVYVEIDIDED
jgi:hypothetical protein